MPVFFRKKSIVIKGKLCYFLKKFGMRTRCDVPLVVPDPSRKRHFQSIFGAMLPKARRITWLVLTAPFSPLLLVFLVSWSSSASWLPRSTSKSNEKGLLAGRSFSAPLPESSQEDSGFSFKGYTAVPLPNDSPPLACYTEVTQDSP